MQERFSIVSGIILLIANGIYIVSILRGKTQPTRGSWITWAVLDIVLIFGMFSKSTLNGQVLVGSLTSLVIACMSFRWGKPGWSILEKACLAVLPFGLLLWYFTNDAVWNIAITLTLIAIGCWPTYESMWEDPSRENRATWTLAFISSLVMLPAIRTWTFSADSISEWAQPIVWLVTQIPIMYLLWVHQK